MTAYQAHRAACRVALADRLPVLNTHPKQLQELTTAVGLAEIGVMGSALLALVNVLDETLHKLEQRYSWHEVVARVPEEQSALELHIQEALAECGLETDVPRRTLDAVRKKAAGSVRRSLVSTVLAAADDEHHPLRVLIDLDPGGKPSTWLRDLDILALARNNAGHECDASFAEELARVPFQRFLQMIEQAIEVLLGDLEEVHA
jgi:hypothetical protein